MRFRYVTTSYDFNKTDNASGSDDKKKKIKKWKEHMLKWIDKKFFPKFKFRSFP